jgi:3-hydroxyisobutyrate dehydrogenase-like beta-hydroxyacid dehydrogenase
MGEPIGRHLLAAGTQVAVFDPDESARKRLAKRGATSCESPEAVAAISDLVLVIVVDDEQVREAVSRCVGGARAGTIVAICASVRPDTCRDLARVGARRDVHVVDSAMVRGERGAEEGALVLFCGGSEEVVEQVRVICAPFTEAVVRVGDVGAGQVAKTANNILLWACIRADFEALRLGRALGVEPAA